MSRTPFNECLHRSEEFRQAYRSAIKDAITFLHMEAREMNDPHAKNILNNAAFGMSVAAAEWSKTTEFPVHAAPTPHPETEQQG